MPVCVVLVLVLLCRCCFGLVCAFFCLFLVCVLFGVFSSFAFVCTVCLDVLCVLWLVCGLVLMLLWGCFVWFRFCCVTLLCGVVAGVWGVLKCLIGFIVDI